MNYRPDIDGLRTIAVVPVVLYHAGALGVTGGFIGVDVFFVISGFLITTIIHRELVEGRFSILRFYERRARRILPALFAVMLASLVAGWFILAPADYANMGESIASALLFVSNLWFWRNSGGYFQGATDYLPMLHTWSLAVEEQFYIFFPLLLMLLHRIGRRLVLPLVGVLVLGSFVLAIWATPRMPSASFYLLPTRIWELGLGSLLALGVVPSAGPRALREAVALAGLAGMLLPIFLYTERTVFPGLAALPPVLGAAAVIWAGTSGPVLVSRLLSLRVMVGIGLLSYSLYLWHWPIMALLRNRLLTVELEPMWQLITILLSVLAGWTSWRFIERPFRVPVRDGGMSQDRIFALSGAGMVGLGLMAGALMLTNGAVHQRFSEEQLARIPPETLRNEHRDRCFGPRPIEALCVFGNEDPEAPVEWILWGDSHADSLLPAFIVLAEEHNVKLAFAGQAGCAPLTGLYRLDLDPMHRKKCNAFNTAVRSYIEQNRSISAVFMHARWATYTSGFIDKTSDLILSLADTGSPQHVDYSRNQALMRSSLEATAAWLSSAGKKVIFVGGTPDVPWDIPRYWTAQLLFGWPLPAAPTPQEVVARQAPAEEILNHVAQKTGSLHIPLAEAICTSGCPLFDGDKMLYKDDDHLSPHGALALALPILREGLAEVRIEATE